MIHLDLDDLLHVARRAVGEVQVRDVGLLAAAAARPRATAFGDEAYPSIHDKAAALLHSLARTQPLVDGNKRLALAATIAFYGVNGFRLTASNEEAYDLVMAVAVGDLDDVGPTAERLRSTRGSLGMTQHPVTSRAGGGPAGSRPRPRRRRRPRA